MEANAIIDAVLDVLNRYGIDTILLRTFANARITDPKHSQMGIQ
jgi:hypothetical protein